MFRTITGTTKCTVSVTNNFTFQHAVFRERKLSPNSGVSVTRLAHTKTRNTKMKPPKRNQRNHRKSYKNLTKRIWTASMTPPSLNSGRMS